MVAIATPVEARLDGGVVVVAVPAGGEAGGEEDALREAVVPSTPHDAPVGALQTDEVEGGGGGDVEGEDECECECWTTLGDTDVEGGGGG